MDISNAGIRMMEGIEGKAGILHNTCDPPGTTGGLLSNCKVTNEDYGMYNDLQGYCTFGIGHNVGRHACTQADIDNYYSNYPNGMSIDDARTKARQDYNVAVNTLNNNLPNMLQQNQFDALVSFIFNEGATGFLNSHLYTYIRNTKQPYDSSRIEAYFLEYVNPASLRIRRQKEINLFNNGIYPP